MIPIWAKIGAKVVCVDGYFDKDPRVAGRPDPKKGETYTIDWLSPHGAHIGLAELHPQSCFYAWNFRPAVTIEDDMKLFEHLKNPSLVDKLDLLAERMNELAED